MKHHSTRSLLIDSIAKTVTEIMVPRGGDIDYIHKLIGCEGCDHVKFGSGIMLAIDDYGLIHIARKAEPPHDVTQGFFVTHVNGTPRHFIAGKAVLWAYDEEGLTVDLPGWVTPALIRQHVAFVADQHRNAAAELCREILTRAGITANPAEYATQEQRYNEIIRRAMALTI
jgi:hypothetical protein